MNWSGLHLAVIGGDERDVEIARLAARTGARVTAHGLPWPNDGLADVEKVDDPRGAAAGADYALLPIPGLDGGRVFAPSAPAPIQADAKLLSVMAPGAAAVLGRADGRLRTAAKESGVELIEYEDDKVLMLERGPAIVEGAIAIAIKSTVVTIHGAPIGVVGQGTIGTLLSRTLLSLGAKVTVFARNPIQRARAGADGCAAAELGDLVRIAPNLAMLFSTVPAPVVGVEVLDALPRGSLVMDLAAPPGSVDLDQARRLGHTAIWARGLGSRAPLTVGRSQWSGIQRRIERREAARKKGNGVRGERDP